MFKRHKILSFLFLLLLIFSMFYFYMYKSISEQFQAQNSINPKATAYFTHAMTISALNTSFLNKIISHDSFLMKPFYFWQHFLFEKGKENLAPNNAEDAVWWFFIYGYEYGIDDRHYNGTKDFFDRNKQEQEYIKNSLYDNAMRIMKIGVKGVDFGEQRDRVVEEYKDAFPPVFIDNQKNMDMYDIYSEYFKKERPFMPKDFLTGKLVLLIKILQQLNLKYDCDSKYVDDYINLSIEILENTDYINKFVKNDLSAKLFTNSDYTFFTQIHDYCGLKYFSKIEKINNLIKENKL